MNPERNAEDPATAEVGGRGLIVLYELYQDDEIDVEVAVGPPLDSAERERIGCKGPRFARLDVPSGELCIETPNSFRLGCEIRAGGYAEPGGVAWVPPGRYVLGLHRVDWQVLAARGVDGHEAWGLAHEFLTLTPESSFRLPAGVTLSPILWLSPEPIAPRPKPDHPPAAASEIVATVVETLAAAIRLSAGPADLASLGVGARGRLVVRIAGDDREAIFRVDDGALVDERTAFFDTHPDARRPPARDPGATARLAELDKAIERQVARWMKAQDKPLGARLFAELEALKAERHELRQASEARDDLPWLVSLVAHPPGVLLVPMNPGRFGFRPPAGAEARLRPGPVG